MHCNCGHCTDGILEEVSAVESQYPLIDYLKSAYVEEVDLIDAIMDDPSSVQQHVDNAINELNFALHKCIPFSADIHLIEGAIQRLRKVAG